MSRHFLLAPVGSGGDVQPFVGIGAELAARGHDVTLVSDEPYRALIEGAGLELVPFGTVGDHERILRNPDLWHPTRGVRLILSELRTAMRDAYALLEKLHQPGRTVLVLHPLAIAGRVFEETHRVPTASVILQPNILRSAHRQPILPDGRDPSSWPRWLVRAMYWMADRLVLDPKIVPALNAWRRELGLTEPVSRLFERWILSPQRILGLFPDWFAEPQPDWPAQLRMTGFPLFDDGARRPLSDDLTGWLDDDGPQPIAFTGGTANHDAAPFFAAAIDATARLGRRAVLLTSDRAQLPDTLPAHARHESYAPFSQLFPRCAAVVHHGGIGTSAQGLLAGVPQLIMPLAFDQPDNADRLRRLGVARSLPRRRFTGERAAAELVALLDDPRPRTEARRLRDELVDRRPLAAACDVLEELGR